MTDVIMKREIPPDDTGKHWIDAATNHRMPRSDGSPPKPGRGEERFSPMHFGESMTLPTL